MMKENTTWCLMCFKRCGFGDPILNALLGLLLGMLPFMVLFLVVVILMNVV